MPRSATERGFTALVVVHRPTFVLLRIVLRVFPPLALLVVHAVVTFATVVWTSSYNLNRSTEYIVAALLGAIVFVIFDVVWTLLWMIWMYCTFPKDLTYYGQRHYNEDVRARLVCVPKFLCFALYLTSFRSKI